MISLINVIIEKLSKEIYKYYWIILAGGRGGTQTVERYVPPPPPTTEADIFGEAVSKGENFGKYHRTQVRCTPEGNKKLLFFFFDSSIHFII